MKDIASDLGVSLMTVSKALRNHVDISSETRSRVVKRAQQLGYQPNWAARSLVAHRTYMAGLVIPDLMHSFFAEVAKAAACKLAPRGYQIIIANSEENAEAEKREIEALLARSVDGLIIASAQRSGGWLRRTLGRCRVPCVLIDRKVRGVEACYVGVDDVEVGSLATRHLLEQGCQRIAHIQGPPISTGRGRLLGYRRVLAEHRLKWAPEYVVPGWHQDVTGHSAMQKLLRLSPPPDGVFCYNDPVAAGAIQAVFEAGLKIPDDVAIVGSGNVHYSDLLRPPLSTVDQSSHAIGETAAEQLLKCIENKRPCRSERILIPVRLVVRESSRRRQDHDCPDGGGAPGAPARGPSRHALVPDGV
jgi:LacI family transcriptional regulator